MLVEICPDMPISDYLIPEVVAVYKEARSLKIKNEVKYFWIRNGKFLSKFQIILKVT